MASSSLTAHDSNHSSDASSKSHAKQPPDISVAGHENGKGHDNDDQTSCWPRMGRKLRQRKHQQHQSKHRLSLTSELENSGTDQDESLTMSLSEPADHCRVPPLVEWCIAKLDNADSPSRLKGIYRVSGNATVIAQLEQCFNSLATPDFEPDLYSVADLLKRHFRTRCKPFFPVGHMQNDLLVACSLPDDDPTKFILIHQMLSALSHEQYEVCRLLFSHLCRLAGYEAETKMTVSNLAMFWAPNLFGNSESPAFPLSTSMPPKTSSFSSIGNAFHKGQRQHDHHNQQLSATSSSADLLAETATVIQQQMKVVETLIINCDKIFGPPTAPSIPAISTL